MQRRMTRPEVPEAETWRLADLFETRAAWAAELAAIETDMSSMTQYQGRLGEGAAVLRACLEAAESLGHRLVRAYAYAALCNAEDGGNPEYQGNLGRAMGLYARVLAAAASIRSEILRLPEGTVERFMAADSELATLKPYLERMLREQPHMLSPDAEVALAALTEVLESPMTTYERAKSSDMRFDPFVDGTGKQRELSFSGYETVFEPSPDLVTRRNAFAAFAHGLKGYQNTLATTFAAEIKKNLVISRVRKYPSATHMLLRNHEVSLEAYHNQHDVLIGELAPHMRRYARLRKRVLGLSELFYCDIEAPLDPGYDPRVSYDEASELIIKGLDVLGPEYGKIVRTALRERWVDRADNAGKSTGAFCYTPYGSHSFILMTWTDSLRDALILAHELGHAGHFMLANRYQRYLNAESSSYFVEAPSTLNELLVAQQVLEGSQEPRMRRWVIMKLLETYHHNFVRHLLEGELQRRLYRLAEQDLPITAQTLNQTKGEVLEQFWGGEVVIDEGARLTWMRQPHYYMGLYPYTYSAGLTAATAVAQLIREEGEPVAERWLSVLKAGGSRPPLELLRTAGVDMTTPEPIRRAVTYVGGLVTELEKSF